MVKFTNLRADKNWIYASAYDIDFDSYADIKVSKHKDKLEVKNYDDKYSNIRKAAWVLI